MVGNIAGCSAQRAGEVEHRRLVVKRRGRFAETMGFGDAGGLNVYVVEVAKRLAAQGVEVDIFTRAVSRDAPPAAELVPGVLVRHVPAGPYKDLDKTDLPGLFAGPRCAGWGRQPIPVAQKDLLIDNRVSSGRSARRSHRPRSLRDMPDNPRGRDRAPARSRSLSRNRQ